MHLYIISYVSVISFIDKSWKFFCFTISMFSKSRIVGWYRWWDFIIKITVSEFLWLFGFSRFFSFHEKFAWKNKFQKNFEFRTPLRSRLFFQLVLKTHDLILSSSPPPTTNSESRFIVLMTKLGRIGWNSHGTWSF